MSAITSLFSSQENDDQFVLSYELLCLLQWLTQHEEIKLKRIIGKALRSGLSKQIKQCQENSNLMDLDQAQQNILDFFYMLEDTMGEVLNEHTIKQAVEKKLIPAVEQIDSTVCDDATVRFSVEKASSKNNRETKESPQEIFFKEILKRWKPSKNMFN